MKTNDELGCKLTGKGFVKLYDLAILVDDVLDLLLLLLAELRVGSFLTAGFRIVSFV
jgi:hypothetical protein